MGRLAARALLCSDDGAGPLFHQTCRRKLARASNGSCMVGNRLGPRYLVEAPQQFEACCLAPVAFKHIADRAVDGGDRPAWGGGAGGVDGITDGELQRYPAFGHLVNAPEGFDKLGG